MLFSRQPHLVFYICYVERAKNTHKNLLEMFLERGFSYTEIAQNVTKEITKDAYIYKVNKA